MYAINGLGQLDAQMIVERLGDSDPHVRRHAILLAEATIRTPTICHERSRDLQMTSRWRFDTSWHLRLARSTASTELSVLEKLIRRDPDDVWMQAAVQSSLV